MREIPDSVVIGKQRAKWLIRYVEDKKWLGKCDPNKRIIYLNSDQTNRGLRKTFIHELLHAMEAEGGFELKHKHIYKLETQLFLYISNNGPLP